MPLDLSSWKSEIRQALEYQKKNGRLDKWRRYRGWYNNEYPSDVISVNLVFSLGRALIPQIYFKAPRIIVRPRKAMFAQTAKVLEAVDTWLIDHIGLKPQMKLMALDAFLVNVGVGKIGYHTISTELPAPTSEVITEVAELLGTTESELSDELARRKWSYHDYIKPDAPWFLRIRPEDVLVPWGFVDEHEAPWVAFRVIRPVEDVKVDPVYIHTSRLEANIKPDMGITGVVSPNLFGQLGSQRFVELFEIWDKRDGTIRVLSLDHKFWLRNEEHDMDITGIPGVVLRFNPTGLDFWGVSDVEQIHKQVIEQNENRTHEIETKRLANVKGIVNQDVIPEEEIIKLEKGKPGPLIRGRGNVRDSVVWTAPPVPRDLFAVDETIRRDIQDILGQSRNQRGEFEGDRRTATEAQIVREASLLRSDERRDLVADALAEIFRDKIHPLLFQNWSTVRAIEVTALGGWIEFTGDQIRGDYDVIAIPDSILPLTKQQEQQFAIQLFTIFRGDPRIQQRELYRRVLDAFKEVVPDPDGLLVAEEDLQSSVQQMALLTALAQQTGQQTPAQR